MHLSGVIVNRDSHYYYTSMEYINLQNFYFVGKITKTKCLIVRNYKVFPSNPHSKKKVDW